MRLSGTTGAVFALVALAAVGGGTFFFKTAHETKRQEELTQQQKLKAEQKMAEAKVADAEAKSKHAAARKAEEDRKKSEADAEAKRTALEIKEQEEVNLKEKIALEKAEAKKAEAQRLAAEAETAKSQAVKAAAEAAAAAEKARAEAEAVVRDKAIAEQKKAEAELAGKLAAQKIADAALAKSDNERKAAEAAAAAEHDRKLRLYARANTSRAELLQLQRAEKLLALEESGMLDRAGDDAASEADAGAEEAQNVEGGEAQTNAVVKVDWPEERTNATAADVEVSEAVRKLDERIALARKAHARMHINKFAGLAAAADAAGRAADAQYYRSTLVSLVPDYVDEYVVLMDEARKAGDSKAASTRLDELIALVPGWQRVSMFVNLIRRDEAYYSRELAGRVSKDEYVKAFRKIYDEARRDKGDRDERDAKVEHICKVLATYVPDFENSPEWK